MSELDQIEAEIAVLTARRQELLTDQGEPLVAEILAPLFEFPGIKNVYWTQGTPSFCDGDPCRFRVGFEPYFNVNMESDEHPEDYGSMYMAQNLPTERPAEPDPADVPDYFKAQGDPRSLNYRPDRTEDWLREKREQIEEYDRLIEAGWTPELSAKFAKTVERVSRLFWGGRTAEDELRHEQNERLFRDVFGDPAQVTAWADGRFDVNDYYME